MPIVTRIANLKLTHDVNEEVLQQWNLEPWNDKYKREDMPIQVTFGDSVPDVEKPNSKTMKKYVHRGERDLKMGYFNGTPIFRVPLEDFSEYTRLRFMERFARTDLYGPHTLVYEPKVEDVRVDSVGDTAGFDMPIWILDYLFAHNFLELSEKFCKLPGVPEVEEIDKAGSPEITKLLRELYASRKLKNPQDRFENYSKQKWYKDNEKRYSVFELEECEAKNMSTVEDIPKEIVFKKLQNFKDQMKNALAGAQA